MTARVATVAFQGIDVLEVDVQVQIGGGGMPVFALVGLPDKAVGESRNFPGVVRIRRISKLDFQIRQIRMGIHDCAAARLCSRHPSSRR